MLHDIEKLFNMSEEFEQSIEKIAKDDPKAVVRNRGKVIFPAEKSKDNKDHYPINNIDEARAALRYAGKQKSAPWYHGTIDEMKKAVERAVYRSFPTLKPNKKESSIKYLLAKYENLD